MASMNTRRVVLGGLLAGVVINVGEFLLNGVILADWYAAFSERLGVPAMGAGAMGLFVVMAFLMGIVAVWLYAAARPRLGPGPMSALKIAAALWFFGVVVPSLGFWAMGMMTANTLLLMVCWEIVELGLAVMAGAWFYREEESARPAEAATPAQPSTF